MKNVSCSLMRDRIEIQSRTLTQSDTGAVTQVWTTEATRWGRVEPLSGSELWTAQSVRPNVTHRITLRYHAGLTPKHRLKIGSRIFNISDVIDTENRKREQVCTCIEEVP